MKKYSFIPIAYITLVFGIIFIPKIIKRITDSSVIENTRLSAPLALSFLEIDGQLRKVPDFVFTNQDNRVITNEDYIGKVYVVEFFFSTCPTICPIMNKNLRRVEKIYGNRQDFGIASFTIDSKNDNPKQLKTYAENLGVFSQNWHFLTSESESVFDLANSGFNIFASINPKVAGGFEHQGYFALVDKNGFIRSRMDKFGNPIVYYLGIDEPELKVQGTDMIIEDIKILLNE